MWCMRIWVLVFTNENMNNFTMRGGGGVRLKIRFNPLYRFNIVYIFKSSDRWNTTMLNARTIIKRLSINQYFWHVFTIGLCFTYDIDVNQQNKSFVTCYNHPMTCLQLTIRCLRWWVSTNRSFFNYIQFFLFLFFILTSR